MSLILFYCFSALMLFFGVGVIFLRSPVSAAMSLVMTFVSLAALFIMLDAFFIGIIQILVYAGAVMVLFLFIIMLLNLKQDARRPLNFPVWLGGGVLVGGFCVALLTVLQSQPQFWMEKPPMLLPEVNDVKAVGFSLFSSFNLPFQVIGVLLVVATVGVVVLSRRALK